MDSKAYKGMLRLALDGNIAAILGGPNRRTRSFVTTQGRRPVRSWEEPWGVSQLTDEEFAMCAEDDILVLLWRN